MFSTIVPAQPHTHALLAVVPEGMSQQDYRCTEKGIRFSHVISWIVTGEMEPPIPVILGIGPDPEGEWLIACSADCKHDRLHSAYSHAKARAWKLSTGTDLFDRVDA